MASRYIPWNQTPYDFLIVWFRMDRVFLWIQMQFFVGKHENYVYNISAFFINFFYQDKFTNTLNEIGHVIGDDKKLGCLYFFLLLLSPITVNVSQVKQVLHALMDLSTGIIIYLGMISIYLKSLWLSQIKNFCHKKIIIVTKSKTFNSAMKISKLYWYIRQGRIILSNHQWKFLLLTSSWCDLRKFKYL